MYVTPKAYSDLLKDKDKLDRLLTKHNAELRFTPDIYINMMEGWTEEECDSVAYLVDVDSIQVSNGYFKIPEVGK
jgi:hypothetical protein